MINLFWDEFQSNLVANVYKQPKEYALYLNESPEDYAERVRVRLQSVAGIHGIAHCNLGTNTFRKVFRAFRPNQRFTQARLIEVYQGMGGR